MQRRSFIASIAAALAAVVAPARALSRRAPTIRVYRLNDYEWFAGPTLDSAIAKWKEYTGLGDEDLDDPRELTDKEMDTLMFAHTDEDMTPIRRQTFREELAEQIANGVQFPEFFATTEY